MVIEIKFTPVTSINVLELYQLAELIWFPAYSHSHSADKLKFLFDKMYNKEEMKEQINSSVKLFYFIENLNAKKIGYFAIEPTEKIIKLDKIYVLQNLQKTGVGSKVIDFIKEYAKKNNAQIITLNVNRKNNNAISFYQKHNFKIIDSIDIDAGNGFIFDDYIMQYGV
jgi:diamine N-acetyltransferase